MADDEPRTAAEFFHGSGEEPPPAYNSWPPSGWFIGPDEAGGDGQPFDWSAPPAGFSVGAAYEWVLRAAALYRYWASIGGAGPRNGPSSSALTNAYMLVDDLRRRGLVPLRGLKRFHVEMDDCPPGFEARELTKASDWLGRAVEACRTVEPPCPRLTANYVDGTVTIDGVTHHVGDTQAAFVHALLASADWVSLKDLKRRLSERLNGVIVSHPERVRPKLPASIRNAIDVDQQKGHRIKREYLG